MKKYLVINEKGEESNLESLLLCKDAQVWKKILKLEGADNDPTINMMNAMHKLEWADPEKSSDKGHFRLYPNGSLIFSLISDWIEEISISEFEAMPITTPLIYNWKNPDVFEQAKMFEKSIYHINFLSRPDDDFVLRFNGDVGVFKLLSSVNLNQNQLPVRIYEMARSFRYLQNGQLSGLSLGRTFLLADMHSFCSSVDAGFEEYLYLHEKSCFLMTEANQEPFTLVKVTLEFYQTAKEIICKMAKFNKKSIVVEIVPAQRQYWIMKHIIHNMEGEDIMHIQLDLENSERYKIAYQDENGIKKYGPIIHTSLGSIERWMTIFLNNAMNQKVPILPIWLSPIQLRILPVKDTNLEYCIRLAKELRNNSIRVDVDDRDISLNKKIKDAELFWVPYIAVCGDKECGNNTLSVRIRSAGNSIMKTSDIIRIIREQNIGKPFRHQPNLMVSKRLNFCT